MAEIVDEITSFTRLFFVTFLGWLSNPLERLTDLQLRNERGHFESTAMDFF